MGKGGTEVARQAADLVLADDDLRTVVVAVEEGRRIYANIRNFLRYAVCRRPGRGGRGAARPRSSVSRVPLLPAQILWINMLTHGLPGVAFGAEPARPTVDAAAATIAARVRARRRARSPGPLDRLADRRPVPGGRAAGGPGGLARPERDLPGARVRPARCRDGVAGPGPLGERRPLDLAVAGAALLQVGGVYVPGLQELLGTRALPLPAAAFAMALAMVPGLAVWMWMRTRRR